MGRADIVLTSLYMGVFDKHLIVADSNHGLDTWLQAVQYFAVLGLSLTMR